jgi:hypothetical protein
MKRYLLVISVMILLTVIAVSCKKGPGEGGNSSINGKVWVRDFNSNFTIFNGQYAGADEDVYIIYGDEKGSSDRVRTNYEGVYEFKYLRPGKYKVYVYSKDSTMVSPSGNVTMLKEVEITDKKQDVEVPTITIYN